ncbi:MAG: hypothetical protein JJU00_16995 [Opitutales bacterium]|nr:hypothetical protein [Opitutales bacterium]
MKTKLTQKSGSVVIAVVIVVLIIAGLVGSYLQLTVSESRAAVRNLMFQGAMNIAEAAAEEAFRAINHNDFSGPGWVQTAQGPAFRLVEKFENGETHTMHAIVLDDGDRPNIVAEGRIHRNPEVSRQVRVVFDRIPSQGLFIEGLISKYDITFAGNASGGADSYNSRLGPYNEYVDDGNGNIVRNRFPNGSVGSISQVNESVEINHWEIFGYAMTNNTDLKLGNHGRVYGPETPLGVKVDPERVVRDFYAEFENVEHPSPAGTRSSADGSGDNLRFGDPGDPEGTEVVYKLSSFSISGQSNVMVHNDVTLIVDEDFSMTGQSRLTLAEGARLRIYVQGDMRVGGGGIINTGRPGQHPVPADLIIYGTAQNEGDQEIRLHGNAEMHGAVYAPNADLSLQGGGDSGAFYGAAVANTISVNGTYTYHFDEALRDPEDGDANRRPVMLEWREVIETTDTFDFSSVFKTDS